MTRAASIAGLRSNLKAYGFNLVQCDPKYVGITRKDPAFFSCPPSEMFTLEEAEGFYRGICAANQDIWQGGGEPFETAAFTI